MQRRQLVVTYGKVIMRKSLQRYNTPGEGHFLTFSCFHRHPFLKNERSLVWLGESVSGACRRHEIALWGYVFMPEHVHLLVKPPNTEYDISTFLYSVKQSVTRKALSYRAVSMKPDAVWDTFLDIQPSGNVHFRFWQRGGGYDRNIWSQDEVIEKLQYMHNNPVKRGLCSAPEEWRWSNAALYTGTGCSPVPVEAVNL